MEKLISVFFDIIPGKWTNQTILIPKINL